METKINEDGTVTIEETGTYTITNVESDKPKEAKKHFVNVKAMLKVKKKEMKRELRIFRRKGFGMNYFQEIKD